MFTNHSNELIKYVEKMVLNKPKSKSKSKKKSKKKSKNKITKEYNDLYKFLNSINTHYNIIEESEINSYSGLNIQIDSPFISETIKSNISEIKNKKSYKLQTNKSIIDINIYHDDINLTKFIKVLNYVISLMFNISHHKILNCTFNFYLTENKKQMLSNKDYNINEFSTDEINSGSSNSNNSTINIWRKEEIIKVTIHECMHLLDYDHKNEDYLLKEIYKKKYNIISESMNIFEAYAEIWAEIINVYVCNKALKGNLQNFIKFLEYEKFFSNYQANKIFYIKSLKDKKNDLNKHTNVLSYYIIKCEIFNDLRNFLNHCRDKENNIEYVKIKKDFKKYLDGLDECKKNNRLFHKINKNSYKYLTMRMTCIEIDLFS